MVVVLLYRKEPFYSRVPEYQAAHLGFFVFIMEFPTLFSMQELSENLLLSHQSPVSNTDNIMSALWGAREAFIMFINWTQGMDPIPFSDFFR